ncbi:hypothetical protein ACFFX0_19710 [Citricoccus parietis]|uniref:Uncharacterized protein n=1 Tax=Citricoccus parietis TaxID=592307 RepID=A0ABV5G2Z1_9MICC
MPFTDGRWIPCSTEGRSGPSARSGVRTAGPAETAEAGVRGPVEGGRIPAGETSGRSRRNASRQSSAFCAMTPPLCKSSSRRPGLG